jgi:predicted nuclease of predicted toxin-antitoxin system
VRLLADENVHGKVVARLRAHGYDLEWIKELSPGTSDTQILERLDISALVFITNDRAFGELVFAKNKPCPAAVLYTRTPHRNWELTVKRLIAVLDTDLINDQFVTIAPESVRYKPLPTWNEK